MTDNLLTRSDGGIQALCSLDSPCLAGLLGCLSAMIAPRVGKMGNICSPSPLSATPLGGRAFYNTIQYKYTGGKRVLSSLGLLMSRVNKDLHNFKGLSWS